VKSRISDNQFDAKAEFPNCCPVYDCPEDAEIIYKNKKGAKKSSRKLKGEE